MLACVMHDKCCQSMNGGPCHCGECSQCAWVAIWLQPSSLNLKCNCWQNLQFGNLVVTT